MWVGAIAQATKNSGVQYAAAGGLATESLTAIRTVNALNGQPDAINRYREYLLDAMNQGIQKNFRVGLATGMKPYLIYLISKKF